MMLSIILKQNVCAHKLYKHTHKQCDGSHSSCQLVSIMSLVPHETRVCHRCLTAAHKSLEPTLLTMRANGKRLRRKEGEKKEKKGSSTQPGNPE